ncbi:type IV toxin-antitoxin system AbiEi family antitoxin domain-containing protein [uncultured Ornithinimicrobium sp.]|uniref:type IV toxin-antitoxin system AbiEi family antitoxin domain-containing protein n=1 Tax=uncultured Ornithinimicrobium sp. TaxID=259307 RepID=UPI0025915FA5|nr:type IV toxin-antitoxin system AbiEi family antitoxin domain-containing protein [uncultured Ornithinimicrobium sp.]
MLPRPAVASRQHGVVTRAQALAAGMTAKQVRWRLHRGDWQPVHRGVYLTTTGTITWQARAWAALLRCGDGACLAMDAAAHVWRLTTLEPATITVGVPEGRHPTPVEGVAVTRRRRLLTRTVDGFPVTRLAQTVIDLADRRNGTLDDAVALAARACQRRSATQAALLEELSARRAHRWGRELRLAFGEIGEGAESLPEVWYVTRVQEPHGLPAFERQAREEDSTRTDLKNRQYGVNLEVDGLVWHAGEQFHGDRRRDRRAAARGEVTLRMTYLELDQSPCDLAVDVARTLAARGWTGTLTPCGPDCPAHAALSPPVA